MGINIKNNGKFRLFFRAVMDGITRKDISALQIYNNAKHIRIGYDFNDGNALAEMFEAIIEVGKRKENGENLNLSSEILEIVRKASKFHPKSLLNSPEPYQKCV